MHIYAKIAAISICCLQMGCTTTAFKRVSGETYYSWLASTYSPVLQYHWCGKGNSGIRVHMSDPKAPHVTFFVTNEDIAAAAQKRPDLFHAARAHQEAFAAGMAAGLSTGARESVLKASPVPPAPEVPSDLISFETEWKRGWTNGFRYGYRKLAGSAFVFTKED